MFDWSTWQRQHVKGVDLCASVIFQHRQRNIAIKALHLWPGLYGQFKGWIEKQLGRELAEGEKMEFDSVYIEKGTTKQATAVLVELWQNNRPLTDYQKWERGQGRIITLGRPKILH